VFAEKENVAILEFDGVGITKDEAKVLTSKLSREIVKNGYYNVLERSEMTTILFEQGFQQSGCISSACAVEVGQILGVKYMISGSIGKLGDIYYVEIKLIDVETSKIIKNVDQSIEGKIQYVLTDAIPIVAAKLSNREVAIDNSQFYTSNQSYQRDELEVNDEFGLPFGSADLHVVSFRKRNDIYINKKSIDNGEAEASLRPGEYLVEEIDKRSREVLNSETVNLREYDDVKLRLGGVRKRIFLAFSCAVVPGANVENIENYSYDDEFEYPYEFKSFAAFGGHGGFILINKHYFSLSYHMTTALFTSDYYDFELNYDSNYGETFADESENVYVGGFITYLREWTIADLFVVGFGPRVGFRYVSSRYVTQPGKEYVDQTSGETSVAYDGSVDRYEFGGPALQFGLGRKKVHLLFSTHLNFGFKDYSESKYYWRGEEDYYSYNSWRSIYNNYGYTEFSFTPEFDFMIRFDLGPLWFE
jgi:TolB-like protein